MLRGLQRKAVIVKTTESSIFEEAIFFLRETGEPKKETTDMVSEANRIIAKTDGRACASADVLKRILRFVACFFCGAALGGGAVVLCFLL